MTPFAKLREDVLNGFYGKSRRAILNALINFNLAADKAGVLTPASVSTKFYAGVRTLAASATEDLDLSGVLQDAAGANLVFTKIHAIYVRANDANTNKVVLGGAASNAFVGPFGANTHTAAVDPASSMYFSSKAGWTVTAATGDILKVTNSAAGTAVTYEIVIVGE